MIYQINCKVTLHYIATSFKPRVFQDRNVEYRNWQIILIKLVPIKTRPLASFPLMKSRSRGFSITKILITRSLNWLRYKIKSSRRIQFENTVQRLPSTKQKLMFVKLVITLLNTEKSISPLVITIGCFKIVWTYR